MVEPIRPWPHSENEAAAQEAERKEAVFLARLRKNHGHLDWAVINVVFKYVTLIAPVGDMLRLHGHTPVLCAEACGFHTLEATRMAHPGKYEFNETTGDLGKRYPLTSSRERGYWAAWREFQKFRWQNRGYRLFTPRRRRPENRAGSIKPIKYSDKQPTVTG